MEVFQPESGDWFRSARELYGVLRFDDGVASVLLLKKRQRESCMERLHLCRNLPSGCMLSVVCEKKLVSKHL
jgi:hypothetical protein